MKPKVFSLSSKFLLIAVASVIWQGCAAIGKRLLKEPKLTFSSVGLRDVGASGVTILFGLQVDNPNPVEITVDSLRYDVEIGGKLISSSKIDKAVSVPAHSNSIVELPVPVKYSDIMTSISSFLSQGSTAYHLKGEAKVSLFTLPFDQTGELKLR